MNKVLLWSLIVAGVLVIIIVLIITGAGVSKLSSVSYSSDEMAASKRAAYISENNSPMSPTEGDLSWLEESKAEEMMGSDVMSSADSGKPENNTQTNAKTERKMIYTADFRIHVKNYEVGIGTAKSLMSDYKGYVTLQTDTRLVVRIPRDYFYDFLDELEKIGKKISKNIQAVEVTDQFYDLKRRIEILETSIKAWEEKRKLAKTDAAMIEIDKIIDEKIEKLEMYKGKMRLLADKIAFSTVTIDFTMDPTPPPTAPRHRFNIPYHWMRYLDVEDLLGNHSYQEDYED